MRCVFRYLIICSSYIIRIIQSSPEEDEVNLKQPTKKRKLYGRMSDVKKKIRLQSHETGLNCDCKRYKCFEVVNEEQRARILKYFNLLPSKD